MLCHAVGRAYTTMACHAYFYGGGSLPITRAACAARLAGISALYSSSTPPRCATRSSLRIMLLYKRIWRHRRFLNSSAYLAFSARTCCVAPTKHVRRYLIAHGVAVCVTLAWRRRYADKIDGAA